MMRYLFSFILIFLLSACGVPVYNQQPILVGELATFKKELVKGGEFWLTTYQRVTDPSKPYVFYIEGDGAAFYSKKVISLNPTPRKHMLIRLASIDQRPNVIYIGRPCQYTPMSLNPTCQMQYWTNKRMSEEVIVSINEVINKINRGQARFNLVGYSGGGGVAVLIAARNPLVENILTIAGNLDHKAFTEKHLVTPMIGSLNPIDYAKVTATVPQLHISGGRDNIVPPFIADQYVQQAQSKCVHQEIYPEVYHAKGWQEIWEYIYTKPISCY